MVTEHLGQLGPRQLASGSSPDATQSSLLTLIPRHLQCLVVYTQRLNHLSGEKIQDLIACSLVSLSSQHWRCHLETQIETDSPVTSSCPTVLILPPGVLHFLWPPQSWSDHKGFILFRFLFKHHFQVISSLSSKPQTATLTFPTQHLLSETASFPRAALKNYHKFGGSEQQEPFSLPLEAQGRIFLSLLEDSSRPALLWGCNAWCLDLPLHVLGTLYCSISTAVTALRIHPKFKMI